jgi:hypothetical protein
MPSLVDELRAIETKCEAAASRLTDDAVANWLEALRGSVHQAAAAWSGSWLGYHASTYIRDLKPRRANEVFDFEWGFQDGLSSATRGDWVTYNDAEVEHVLVKAAGVTAKTMQALEVTAKGVGGDFDDGKRELLPILDALVADGHRSPVREVREAIQKAKSHLSVNDAIAAAMPRQVVSRDPIALARGLVTPPHVKLLARVEEIASYGRQASMLADSTAHVRKYLERRAAMTGSTASPVDAAPQKSPRQGAAMTKAPRTTETRLFVSHSSVDAPLAEAFTSLVDGALAVPHGWIRCTSVVGYKLEPGADGPDELRANLHDADVVVGLLTKSSLASKYVLMELGAAWGFRAWAIPFLGVGIDFKDIPGPLGQIHGISVADEASVAQLLETISTRCKMPWRAGADKRHRLVKMFVDFASA